MKTIQFIEDYQVKAENGAHYEAGKRYTVRNATANHFINNGVAKIVKAGEQPEEKKPEHKNQSEPAAQKTLSSVQPGQVSQSKTVKPQGKRPLK